AIACAAFILIFAFNVPFPLIVLLAALSGYLLSKFDPKLFTSNVHASSLKDYGKAIIDDDTPTPEHAIFKWSRLIKLLVVAIILWCLP
ncbi:chromate transporter, partial [Klebsiella pneumoniae]|nr:chromate transporter [Klebsiella pneumoniae]